MSYFAIAALGKIFERIISNLKIRYAVGFNCAGHNKGVLAF